MREIIIYGNSNIADVMYYYFSHTGNYKVVAFTSEQKYITTKEFNGLPIIPFSEVQTLYPPVQYDMFIALGYLEMNEVRTNKYLEAKKKGYNLVNFIHPRAEIPNDIEFGDNIIIMNNVTIFPKVKLGSNVFIWSGSIIGHHSLVGDNCWLSSPTFISGNVKVGRNCFFGANATLGHDIYVGDYCFLGAKVLQVKDLQSNKVIVSEPSKALDITSKEFAKIFGF